MATMKIRGAMLNIEAVRKCAAEAPNQRRFRRTPCRAECGVRFCWDCAVQWHVLLRQSSELISPRKNLLVG